ncbi:MAG: lactate racemase domain-containing protein [Planctomycetaceae bacterium]|jgi:nickel-dependent lactate racemase|nr:lactate racemase domain-containing protein [Planctomycetaceae bacterium]
MPWFYHTQKQFTKKDILDAVVKFADEAKNRICAHPKRVLLLPPDITRAHSGAGYITEELYKIFAKDAEVRLIPTLGQHVPHTPEQNRWMFGSVPEDKIDKHNWRTDSKTVGEIPADYVKEISGGKADWAIPVAVNRKLFDEKWDIILNIGHVVPHEVLGFANHNKNYFIGLGGKEMICASHLMAACCGIENNLGTLTTPLRACFNKAEEEFLGHLPDAYFQVVMAYSDSGELVHTGVYAGEYVETYLAAAKASRKQNITVVPPLKKVVAVMQGDEFYSTWVANKAIYRTRKAMADGGELLIIAPGLKRFGEQPEIDSLIRKYGYAGTEKVMELYRKAGPADDLKDLAVGTAHLIHGSSEGRFTITYAPGHLTEKDLKTVNFGYADYKETVKRYDPQKLKNGFNTMPDGEEIYFISTPSAGLWSTAERMQ